MRGVRQASEPRQARAGRGLTVGSRHGICPHCLKHRRLVKGRACTTCYWPDWATECLRCSGRPGEVAYRSSGLCVRCHRLCRRERSLDQWKRLAMIRRRGRAWPGYAALRIVRLIGVSGLATRMRVSMSTAESWVVPDPNSTDGSRWHEPRPVPAHLRERLAVLLFQS